MKRSISILLCLAMLSTFFTFAIPASAEILSSDTVVVSASLAGENGALEEVAIGDKSYTVSNVYLVGLYGTLDIVYYLFS